MRKHRKKNILTVYHPSRLKRGYSFENAVDGNAVTYTNEDHDNVGLYFLRGSQTGPQADRRDPSLQYYQISVHQIHLLFTYSWTGYKSFTIF